MRHGAPISAAVRLVGDKSGDSLLKNTCGENICLFMIYFLAPLLRKEVRFEFDRGLPDEPRPVGAEHFNNLPSKFIEHLAPHTTGHLILKSNDCLMSHVVVAQCHRMAYEIQSLASVQLHHGHVWAEPRSRVCIIEPAAR